jgi:hypothetical protein
MKHIVTLTISNPAHEHISLRRRQSTTNYMVEARDEAEAIFRASNHFKKLGNYVHNAVIAESTLNEEVEQIDEVISAKERKWREAVIDKHGDTVRFKKKRHEDAKTYHTVAFKGNNDKYVGNFLHSKGGGGAMFSARSGAGGKWTEVSEEVEQINEIGDTPKGKAALASYITKASRQSGALHSLGKEFDDDKYKYAKKALKARTPKTKEQAKTDMETAGRLAKTFTRKAQNRTTGISRAAVKMAKEEVEQIDEDALKARQEWMKAKGVSTGDPKADRARKVKRLMKTFPMKKEEVELDEALDLEVNNYAKHMLNAHSADDLHVGNEHRDMAHQTLQDIKKNYGPVGVRWANARAGEHIENHNKAQREAEKASVMKRYKPTPAGAKVYQYPKSEVKEEVVNEKAPPGAKYERMVKHIKDKYSEDGTLTPKEKAIAYATAWKAKNSGK